MFSTDESAVELMHSSIKDESLVDSEISNGFSDTLTGSFYNQYRHYFPELLNTNFGFRTILNLSKNQTKKIKFYIPLTVFYERLHYANLILGTKYSKRVDTILNSDKTYYVDSTDQRKVSYRNYSNRIFVQSGINAAIENKIWRLSLGVNLGIGASFLNEVDIYKEQRVHIGTTEYTQGYQDNDIYNASESKTVKGKSSFVFRTLVPVCLAFKPKKSHFGIMAEINPGIEINTFTHKAPIFSWIFYTSFGICYSF